VPSTVAGPAPSPDELLARRRFGGTAGTRQYERQPLIGLLGTAGDGPGDQVRAGIALQRVLLTATDLGLATSIFTQPVDVATVREQLGRALGRQHPAHVLMRFGYAVGVSPTSRRPAHDVIASP
jgi:hypothetical protein